jgi:CelD/BcsL family acetyltransferase involved in cellulose biosynthesis
MEVVEAHSQEDFLALRDEWHALLSRCSRATIFQTWEWNYSWWRTLGAEKKLLILQAWEGGRLLGLAPLFRSHRLRVQRVIQFIGSGRADYMDVLATDEQENEICRAILCHLLSTQMFDLVDLGELQSPSPLCEEAIRLAGPTSQVSTFCKEARESCLGVSLPSSWEDFCSQIGRKMVRSLGYKKGLLTRNFDQVEMRLADGTELQDAMTALFDLHRKRWQLRGKSGALSDSRIQEFYRLLVEQFDARGWLRLHLVKLNGRFAAVACCFRFRDRYYGHLSGFDPELARYGVGSLMVAQAVQQAIEEGCSYFDMLRGEEDYKRQWLCKSHLSQNLLFVSCRGLRPRLMAWARQLEQSFVPIQARMKKALDVGGSSRFAPPAAHDSGYPSPRGVAGSGPSPRAGS